MSVKSSISLTDPLDAFARSLVSKGQFSSVSAVIQQSLELLRQKTESDDLENAALRELLSSRQKGSFVNSTEMDARLNAMIERKKRQYRVER